MPAGDDIFLDTLDSSHKNFEEETSRFHKEAAADQAMKTTDLNTLLAEHEAKKAAGSLSPRSHSTAHSQASPHYWPPWTTPMSSLPPPPRAA